MVRFLGCTTILYTKKLLVNLNEKFMSVFFSQEINCNDNEDVMVFTPCVFLYANQERGWSRR